MSKIGILTFHAVTNYGAVLQAYALRKHISDGKVNCEIIDYQNTIIESQYNPVSLINLNIKHPKLFIKNFFMIPHIVKRNSLFRKFRDRYLVLSEKKWDEKNASDINGYSAIIAGSDQIWNFRCNGNDANYLLDFVKEDNCKCYSYAASSSTNEFSDSEKGIYKSLLSKFKYISTREKSAATKFESLLNRNVSVSVDPTLLVPASHWSELAETPSEKKYVLVFLMTFSKRILENAYNFAQKENLDLVYINLTEPFIDRKYNSKFALSPEQWLGYFKNAEYVVTNSFHGSVFSLIFKRKFITYTIADKGKNERIFQLMDIAGTNECMAFDEDIIQFAEIDYEKVSEKINVEVNHSKEYIADILKDIE